MTYAAELDDRRQEVRRGYAGNVLRYWPKAPGVGNVAVTAPSCTLASPSGASLGAASVTNTTVGGVSRLDIAVDASASSFALDENYAAQLTYTYDGQTVVQTMRFDVVREPWDGSDVGLNDLRDEVADIGTLLQTLVNHKGDESRTIEQEASLLGVRAASDVKSWIKASAEAKGRMFARLILQRDELRGVVVAQALARAYRAQPGGTDGPTRELAKEWTAEAKTRLEALGELDYDRDEDGVAETVVGGWATIRIERSWT